jgi:hypothetical protein
MLERPESFGRYMSLWDLLTTGKGEIDGSSP